MIKLIALDFDWTIIDYTPGKPRWSPELFGWLGRFIERGGQAGIVSGRAEVDLREFMYSKGLGWASPFPSYVVEREEYLRLTGAVWPGNAEKRERVAALTRLLLPHAADWLERFESEGLHIKRWFVMNDYTLEYSFASADEARRGEALLRDWVARETAAECFVQRNGALISVMDVECGKGKLLRCAAEYFGVSPEETLAIGDSLNDESMLDGGFGFLCGTPENGDEVIKDIVRRKDGIIGVGTAYDGVLDIFRSYAKRGLLPVL